MSNDSHLRMLAVLMALALAPPPALAQARTVARVTTTPPAVTPARQMKDALRSLVVAQEEHRAAHATYAADPADLYFTMDRSVQVEILGASSEGWAARARHAARPGKTCVIYVGTPPGMTAPVTEADRLVAGESATPLCDRTE